MNFQVGRAAWHEASWPRAFFTAVQFLTRIPVPGGETRDLSTFPEDIKRGLQFFPVIGAGVGALTALALLIFDSVLPLPLAVIAALAVEARLTGAFHEDAVADFCDAFGGGWTRDEVLRILKDSRIGSYGALGLVLAVALRAGGLIALDSVWSAVAALVIAGMMARLVILAVMAVVPPVAAREGLRQGRRAGGGLGHVGARCGVECAGSHICGRTRFHRHRCCCHRMRRFRCLVPRVFDAAARGRHRRLPWIFGVRRHDPDDVGAGARELSNEGRPPCPAYNGGGALGWPVLWGQRCRAQS